VSGISVLSNHVSDASLDMLRGLPSAIGVGLHACFTLRPFVSPDSEIGSFLDDTDSPLKPSPRFLEAADRDEVRREFARQLDRCHGWDLNLTHLDSHHHVHRRPDVLELFCCAAKLHDMGVRTIDSETRSITRQHGARTTDHFVMGFYGEGATLENLRSLLTDIPEGVTELMTHPALDGPGLPGVTSYAEGRVREFDVLSSEEFGALLEALDIEIVSWDAVPRDDAIPDPF
jgi:predicted glycoside hydrolase/deacetylase ChbG (UPF0249 family)